MTYTVLYHHDVAGKDLPRIPRNMQQKIRRAIENRLLVDPVQAGQPLRQSLHGHRRLRSGDYRVIYRINGAEIIVLKISHRRDVYLKVFSRLRSA